MIASRDKSVDVVLAAAVFAANLRLLIVPSSIVDRTRLIVLDTLGVQIAASGDPIVSAIVGSLASQGSGSASVVGCEHQLPPAQAAFVNGLLGAWLDYDEVSFEARQHPAIHVIPAALAVAEHVGASGEAFLEAIIAGYEIGGRVGRASTPRPGLMHPHGIHGTVGAAVAAGKLFGQDSVRLAETMRIATSMTVATSWGAGAQGATVRHTYSGQGAQNGVLAAILGDAGIVGEQDGFATVFGKISGVAFDDEDLVRGIGGEFLIASNMFKSYDCGADAHPAVEAVRCALGGRELNANDIKSVSVWVHAGAARLAKPTAKNPHSARLSLPFVVARTLLGRSLGVDAFEEGAREDKVVNSLMRRILVQEDLAATAAHPAEQRARAEIEMRDGQFLRATFVLDDARRRRWPSAEGIVAKFRTLTNSLGAHSELLVDEVARLGRGSDARAIGASLRKIKFQPDKKRWNMN